MIPTLRGRLQTRIFAVVVIGGICTLLIAPILPGLGESVTLADRYRTTYSILAAVLVLGLGWELIYHLLQQFRWEKDWPTLFGLLTGINEAALLAVVLAVGLVPNADPAPPTVTWLTHFTVVWLAIFLFLNGPMKVVFIRWRFQGGRLLGP